MCGSMVDIQSRTAEIRRGKNEERRTNHRMKIWPALLHRAAINENSSTVTGHHTECDGILKTNGQVTAAWTFLQCVIQQKVSCQLLTMRKQHVHHYF